MKILIFSLLLLGAQISSAQSLQQKGPAPTPLDEEVMTELAYAYPLDHVPVDEPSRQMPHTLFTLAATGRSYVQKKLDFNAFLAQCDSIIASEPNADLKGWLYLFLIEEFLAKQEHASLDIPYLNRALALPLTCSYLQFKLLVYKAGWQEIASEKQGPEGISYDPAMAGKALQSYLQCLHLIYQGYGGVRLMTPRAVLQTPLLDKLAAMPVDSYVRFCVGRVKANQENETALLRSAIESRIRSLCSHLRLAPKDYDKLLADTLQNPDEIEWVKDHVLRPDARN
jgi:hypothetical protein